MCLQPMIEFIDDFCLDEQLYWRLPLAEDEDVKIELQWQRQQVKERWRMRRVGHAVWRYTTSDKIVACLKDEGVVLDIFREELQSDILTQAVFGRFVAEAAAKLFSKEEIDNAVQRTLSFFDAMSDVVHNIAEASPQDRKVKNPLRLIHTSEE